MKGMIVMPRLKFTSPAKNMLSLLVSAVIFTGASTGARAEASGPDAWRIANISPGSTLNVRIGPGTEYPRIDELASDARHLRYTECVPYLNAGIWENLNPTQKERFGNLHHQWCFVLSEEGVKGWVNKFYLAEDSLPDEPDEADGGDGQSEDSGQ